MESLLDIVVGLGSFLLLVIIFWIVPIHYGIKWAKLKGVSRMWMLFGLHPMLGWIAYLIIRFGIEPRKVCIKCKEQIKLEAQICRYCGNQMSPEEVHFSVMDYQKRKNSKKNLI